MTDTNSEEYRHRCEVITVLRWRAANNRQACYKHFDAVEEQRGRQARNRLEADVREQWALGNRGQGPEDWRNG